MSEVFLVCTWSLLELSKGRRKLVQWRYELAGDHSARV